MKANTSYKCTSLLRDISVFKFVLDDIDIIFNRMAEYDTITYWLSHIKVVTHVAFNMIGHSDMLYNQFNIIIRFSYLQIATKL
jgi:hypothetical protein